MSFTQLIQNMTSQIAAVNKPLTSQLYNLQRSLAQFDAMCMTTEDIVGFDFSDFKTLFWDSDDDVHPKLLRDGVLLPVWAPQRRRGEVDVIPIEGPNIIEFHFSDVPQMGLGLRRDLLDWLNLYAPGWRMTFIEEPVRGAREDICVLFVSFARQGDDFAFMMKWER